MRHMHHAILVGLLLAGLACVAVSQQTERQMQMGVKTSDPGYVASLRVEVPLADMQGTGQVLNDAYDLLVEATKADGWTLVGKARVVFEVSMEARPEGLTPVHVQLFIVEQPSEEEMNAEQDYKLLKVDAEKVAYTFHKGPAEGLQSTLTKLAQWMIGEGIDMQGFPCVLVHDLSSMEAPEVYELQIPAK